MEFTLDEIKDLLDSFEERRIHKFQLKRGEFELLLERSADKSGTQVSTLLPHASVHQPITQQLPPHFPGHEKAAGGDVAVEEATGKYIESPMVGTFYGAPAPGEPAFVGVGDTVKEGDVVCIVEAMKVMNEVKATESGVIKEVLVEDGHPVEFGTKIFKIG